MKKYNKIITKELNRILPYHLLGIVFHTIVIYLSFKIPESIGKILDMLSQSNIDKNLIMQEAYWLIFYCSIVFIPRTLYRILYFTISRKADTYLRKEVVKHLQKVKPEYFEKENKGAFLAYLSKEILSIHKILGNYWFHFTKIFVTPIMAILLIWGQFNKSLALWIIPIFPVAIICMFYCYKKLKEKVEVSRKTYIELSKNIEQNTDGFLLIKSYNQQKNQIKFFKNINSKMYKADYEIGVAKNHISRIINILYGLCFKKRPIVASKKLDQLKLLISVFSLLYIYDIERYFIFNKDISKLLEFVKDDEVLYEFVSDCLSCINDKGRDTLPYLSELLDNIDEDKIYDGRSRVRNLLYK